ncbi:hypothetical protein MGG_09858 [Pyricularia oryzae 70-15]|uniref:Cellulose-binding Sde182 C-terminal domain-containing protein n=3 Tax=Pyricularia oryzae TaxID=318829 RepID=G4NIF1_PYRO7|nr:uncharacterized protein MGG_09858 [Pyricularia oryzae 70-15]EHA48011.1 hypothetical protein MGG_09858 [Pyricularia oryzae 70-15]ELQ45087.1 hypothetical protein OOU_Y34scaffold00021g27 [Pyricularia oryzae Y34]
MLNIVDAYTGAVDNLDKHVHIDQPYQPADCFRELVRSEPTVSVQAFIYLALKRILQVETPTLTETTRKCRCMEWKATGLDIPISPRGAHLVSRLCVYATLDQDDSAAWIQWTAEEDFDRTNQAPVVSIVDSVGPAPAEISAEAGSTIALDADRTYDTDGDELTFKWWQYKDCTASQCWVGAEVKELQIKPVDRECKVVEVTLPSPEKCCCEMLSRQAVAKGQLLHLILEVTDNGSPALTTYRRALIQATNLELISGAKEAVESVGDSMEAFEGVEKPVV